MNALEFKAKIEQGKINLPLQYQNYENKNVRVIVLIDEPIETDKLSQGEKLILAFEKIKGKNMFTSIENPTIWQKRLRDEWE